MLSLLDKCRAPFRHLNDAMMMEKKMKEMILNRTLEIIRLLTGEVSLLHSLANSLKMSEMNTDKKMILNHSLEIIYLLTGEEYTIVKRKSHSSVHHLTGEVPIKYENAETYSSMEEQKCIETQKDLFKDVTMENPQITRPLEILGYEGAGAQDKNRAFVDVKDEREEKDIQTVKICSDSCTGVHGLHFDAVSGTDEEDTEKDGKDILEVTIHSDLCAEPSQEEKLDVMGQQQVKKEEIPINISEDGHMVRNTLGQRHIGHRSIHFVAGDLELCESNHEENTPNSPNKNGSKFVQNLDKELDLHVNVNLAGQCLLTHKDLTAEEEEEALENNKNMFMENKSHEFGENSVYSITPLLSPKCTLDLEKTFECSDCGKCFTRKSSLANHKRIHSGMKPFACSECGKCFSQASNLVSHKKIHTGEKSFPCSECGKCFTHAADCNVHKRIHTGEKPFTCSECGKSFSRKSNLVLHERFHEGVKQFVCSECGKSFMRKSNLLVHERVHTGVKPFVCYECGKCFRRKTNLDLHERVHTGLKPFACSECGKCFSQSSNLISHMRIHTGDKPFVCSECGKCFTQAAMCDAHIKIHTGEKPFTCSECGKCFIKKSALDVHERVHTGIKPYACPECGRSFTKASHRDIHMRIHTGDKQFTCSECGKCFSRKLNLVLHESVHLGEKTFACIV